MKHIASAFTLVCVALAPTAYADDTNAQKALQKAQFMLRQATSEKAELQTQLDAANQQVEQLSRELTAAKSGAANDRQRTEEKYSSAIAQWKQRDTDTAAELAAIRQQLKQEMAQRREVESQLQKQKNNFAACYENNKKLSDIGTQLLSRYENKGFGDVLKQREPFTGISRVELENLVQDYRYQLDGLRVQTDQNNSDTDGAGQSHNNQEQ